MKTPYEVFLPFDLETTGLLNSNPAVLELACCPINKDLEDLPEYESGVIKVYDNRTISPQALMANGITMDQINNGRNSQQVADEFVKYLKKLCKQPKKIILCGHNIDNFDIPIFIDFLQVHGYDLSKLVNTDFTIDTMFWGRIKHLESENYKLGTCCKNVGIDLVNAHRAITDTRANKELVKNYLSSLRGMGVESVDKGQYKRPTFETWK